MVLSPKNILILIFVIKLFYISFAQNKQNNKIQWYTLKEAFELNKKNPRKILIDVYTKWCGWCKKMDITTYSNPDVVQYINNFFYPVKLDAETHDTIEYQGKKYINSGIGRRPAHQLAIKLLNGKMSYPSTVFLDEKNNSISVVPGYLSSERIQPILIFFSRNVYKTSSFDSFNKYFKQTFRNQQQIPDTSQVNWLKLNKAIILNRDTPKKIFINIYVNNDPLQKIMNNTTYNNPEVAEVLNKYFLPVQFYALSSDTINFNNKEYKKSSKYGLHEFVIFLLQGKINIPTAVYLDKTQIISVVPGYYTPEDLKIILMFFAEDRYKKMSFAEYKEKVYNTKK